MDRQFWSCSSMRFSWHLSRDVKKCWSSRASRFLAQLLRIELVPILVDESQLCERHPILLSDNFLHRIAERDNRQRLLCAWNREVFAHLLILNSRVDSGNNPFIPRGQLHVLDCPASVNKVETRSRSGSNNHCEVSTHNPTPRCTILGQLFQHLLLLDKNEPPLLLVVARSRGASSLKDPQLYLSRNTLRIELTNIQLTQNRLVGIQTLLSQVYAGISTNLKEFPFLGRFDY